MSFYISCPRQRVAVKVVSSYSAQYMTAETWPPFLLIFIMQGMSSKKRERLRTHIVREPWPFIFDDFHEKLHLSICGLT